MLAEVRYSRPHHPEVLCFLQNELDCLRYNSQLDQALELAYKSFEGTCREWGEGHPKASNAAGQLKDCLWDLGMQDEAEKVARNNLIIMQDSPHSTDSSMVNDIAMLLDVLSGRQMSDGTDTGIDRKEDMRGLVVAALQLVKKIPPETLKLPSTLQDLIYLSSGLEIMKFYPELESLERKIYDNCEVVYGLSDRNTINSLVRLSSSVRNQNRSKEADYICHDAIEKLKEEVEKQKVGVKSAHLAALSWLAVLHKHVGEHSAAKEVYEKAYNYVIVGDYIDTADYETLYSIQGLAEDIDDQKDFERAQVLHVRVLRARESKFKDGHPCLDDSLYAYSWNLRLQKRLPMALKYCKKAYEIAVKFRGNHRNTFCILKRLAYLKEQLGMTAEAEAHYREVLESFRNLGSRHMTRVTEAIEDLQELLMEQQKWEDAKPLIEEAMERRRRGWDKNPGHYAGLMRHLAIVTWNLGDGETGLKLYREARVAYENAWGVRDPDLDPVKMQKLIERINELLPGTETMAEEERRQEVQAEKQLKLDEAAAEARAREINKDRRKAEEETASAKAKEVARTQQKVEAKLEHYNEQAAGNAQPVSHVQYDGKTQSYQMSVKQNEEAVVGNESLSRSTTLAMDADEQNHMTVGNFPEAPKHEPSRFAEDLSSQMGRLQVREPAT